MYLGLHFEATNFILCSETQILSVILAIIITTVGIICNYAGQEFNLVSLGWSFLFLK